MDNVLDITPHLPEKPQLDVELPLAILKRVFQSNRISRHAFGVGAYVLAKMQASGEYKCAISREEVYGVAVMVENEPLIAVGHPEISEFANALYALQAECGLWNHTLQHRAGKGTQRYNHFTEKLLGENNDYQPMYKAVPQGAAIYFVWLPDYTDKLLEDVKDNISHSLMVARWANISINSKV